MEERSNRILEKFRRVAVSEVTNPDLLKILQNVQDYWKDPLRPSLTSFSCEAVGGTLEGAVNAGVMFTLASAGFGIHDDIIDRSSKKHFRRTVPSLFGVDGALLAGDLLIVKASTMLQQIFEHTQSEKAREIIRAYGSLYTEICEAEFMSLSFRDVLEVDLETYSKMLWKSAGDTEACGMIGATLGGGSKQEIYALSQFGRRTGFVLRLLDDVKDICNIEGNLPQRLKNERVPLQLLYAAKTSKTANMKIKSTLDKKKITPTDVCELLDICLQTKTFDYIKKIAKKTSTEAIQDLCILKPSFAREMLTLLNRKSLAELNSFCP